MLRQELGSEHFWQESHDRGIHLNARCFLTMVDRGFTMGPSRKLIGRAFTRKICYRWCRGYCCHYKIRSMRLKERHLTDFYADGAKFDAGSLAGYARSLGLDVKRFASCLGAGSSSK
jgi:hypothetical protein